MPQVEWAKNGNGAECGVHMKILLAVDNSKCAMRAVSHVIRNLDSLGTKPQIHLLHVQPPLPGRVTAALSRQVVHGYYRDESKKALSPARRALDRRRIRYKEIHLIGEPGLTIAAYAKQGKFPLIVMGSHGQGALSSLVLGSVARKVLANCGTPALIIR